MRKSSLGKLLFVLLIGLCAFTFYLYRAEPGFLLDRFYDRVYADRLAAEPEVLLGETPVLFDLTAKEWSLQKDNGKWYRPPEHAARSPKNADDPKETETLLPASEQVKTGVQPQPAAIVSKEDKLTLGIDKVPEGARVKITDPDTGQIVLEDQVAFENGHSVANGSMPKGRAAFAQLPLPGRNGTFTYELALEWTGETAPYRGAYVMEFPVTVDLPVEFVFSGQKLAQGQLLEITANYADSPEDILFEQSIYNKFKWYREEGGGLTGYLPTNYNVKPGVYLIRYGVKSKGTEFTQEIEVTEYPYHIQYLTVDKKTEQETRNDAAYAEYNKYYIPVRNESEPTRYYKESFLLPVKGRLTTEFGETRYVNDQPTSYRHLGLDIAAPEGTEVKASNRGKVVLARSLILTGNTVMIDHGEGLFSVYHHMLNLSVKKGEIVERGQKIGEVGSTGFSTGAHLHFMISYYSVNLEPGYFLVGQPVTYENYREFIQ